MKKIIVYIIMFMFLIIPISHAGECFIEKDSMLAGQPTDFILFDFFLKFEEEEFINFMFKNNYITVTPEKIEIIEIVNKVIFKNFNVIAVKVLSDKKEEIIVWAVEDRIKCKKKRIKKGIEV